MRQPRRFAPAALAAALAALAVSARAHAQYATQCDSCASCTSALAAPRARIELAQDISADGAADACIVVRGAGAQFNGREHTVRGAGRGAAVRLEGADQMVRNVHAENVAVGVDVAAAATGAVVFHDTVRATETGVRVAGSENVRVTRMDIRGGRVGVAFGDAPGGRCTDGQPLRSPGAVLHHNRVEGAAVGVAACDATPVFTENTLRGNGVGIVLGAPARGAGNSPGAAGPYDACVCAPTLSGVRPSTTLLYSTGCGGCIVHEGWVPQLRAAHHDIRVRETGREHLDDAQRYDDFIDHCAPEITDAIGIPGCVPNYTCLANAVVFKSRGPGDELQFGAQLDAPEAVATFAEACETAATQNYATGRSCVRYQFRGNLVCGNREADIRAAAGAQRMPGHDDACGHAEGFNDGSAQGCARPCTAEDVNAPAPTPSGPVANPNAAPTNPSENAPPPTPTPTPSNPPANANANAAPSDNGSEPDAAAAGANRNAPRGPFGLTRNALYAIGGAALAGLIGVIASSSRKRG